MRFPILPTLLVAAAVATMICLGIWQLGRAEEKDAQGAQYRNNVRLPAMALPTTGSFDRSLLYRRASAFCVEVIGWRKIGGRSASGRSGTRHIADCRTGAEGPGFATDMGVSADPKVVPQWRGGEIEGIIALDPGRAGLLERLTGKAPPPRPMLVSLFAAPGLEPTAPPRPDGLLFNSSHSYAIQWFFFAALAAIIYLLALRRRQREKLPPAA
jgi:surfeit locus 1 family protein